MILSEVYRRADLAIRLGVIDYATGLCQAVLETFPTDLSARLLLGQALLEHGSLDDARRQFDLVLDLDPENVLALGAIGVVLSGAGELSGAVRAFERAYELRPSNTVVRDSLAQIYAQRDGATAPTLPIAPPLAVAIWKARHGQMDAALDDIRALRRQRPGDLPILLIEAETLWRAGRSQEAEQVCRQILARHPRVLKPRLILANLLSADRRREAEGVVLLHYVTAQDPGGVVARRLFRGSDFVCPTLADDVAIAVPPALDPAPAQVTAALDVLSPSELEEDESEWEPPAEMAVPLAVRATSEVRIASAAGDAEGADLPAFITQSRTPQPAGNGLAPTVPQAGVGTATLPPPRSRPTDLRGLLAISCRSPIVSRYGFEGYQRLDRRLQQLRDELRYYQTALYVAFVDDPYSMGAFDLRPPTALGAAEIKTAIDQVERALVSSGQPVEGIVLLGGGAIVPFFQLPNPAADDDVSLLSDNPYASRTGSPLYPQRSVGRLPDGDAGNLSLLLRQLDTLIDTRRRPPIPARPTSVLETGRAVLGRLMNSQRPSGVFGYGAAVWEEATAAVFGAIGARSGLRLCPPARADLFEPQWLADCAVLHFNLHGRADGPSWYGQDPDPGSEEDDILPAAFGPDQLTAVHLVNPVIFSEASYGALITGKTGSTSLALRFLGEGAMAFIGSTGPSFGGASPPLSGIDLIAQMFWENVRSGYTLGVALGKAKQSYALLVSEHQGFLDPDDRRTLLSIVLYGDPLAQPYQASGAEPTLGTDDDEPEIGPSLVVRRLDDTAESRRLRPLVLPPVLAYLTEACPEVCQGRLRIHALGDGKTGTRALRTPSGGRALPHLVVSARRTLPTSDGGSLEVVARVTVGEDNTVIKMVTSR